MFPPANVPGANYEEGDAGGMTVLLYGAPGSHKTTWSAQWPGVLFLSIASEGGDDALKMYPQIAAMLMEASKIKECPPVFNTGKPPRISIHGAKQFVDVIDQVCQNHKAWGVCTIVVDSLTYLIDLWIDEFVQHMEASNPGWRRRVQKQGGEILGPKEWGFLNMYLRSPRVKLGSQGLNVIWTCLQKDTLEADERDMTKHRVVKVEPMITGQTKVKLPGACKLHIHAERTKIPDPNAPGRMKVQPTFWTAPNMLSDIRHKYFNKFPQGCLMDPEFGTLPTFRALWAELHEYIYTG